MEEDAGGLGHAAVLFGDQRVDLGLAGVAVALVDAVPASVGRVKEGDTLGVQRELDCVAPVAGVTAVEADEGRRGMSMGELVT